MHAAKPFLLIVGILITTAIAPAAQDAAMSKESDMLWLYRGDATSEGSLAFLVEDGQALSKEDPEITFSVRNLRPYAFRKASIKAELLSAAGKKILSGKIKQDLLAGDTPCVFELDTHDLAHGTYTLAFSLESQISEENTTYTATLWHGTSGMLLEQLESIETHLKGLLENSAPPLPALCRARVNIALHFCKKRNNDRPETWVPLINYLHTVQRACQAASEDAVAPATPTGEPFVPGAGGFYQGDRPVYLAGVALEDPDAAWLDRVAQWNLNFASVKVGPSYTLTAEGTPKAPSAALTGFLHSAQKNNLGLALRLSPHQAEAQFPTAVLDDMTNLAHPELRAFAENHLDAMMDTVQGYPNVCAISLAEDPQFIFDGEAVRQGFLEQVQLNYPDRQELNQLWHAHIASYDDITIWDEEAPAYSYHYDQPYQYIFQTYHRSLATKFLGGWHARAQKRTAPALPFSVTLSDLAFELDESRFGADREALAAILEVAACTSASQSVDEHYALNYPRGAAYYTLMRSVAPEKPLLNLEGGIAFPMGGKATADAAYVRTVLWEGVLSGLSGIALPYDSPVFDRPETLDAFVECQEQFNRLGGLLQAFQNTPKTIAILISTSSTIYENGNPHLESVLSAYEGASFSGYSLRFITEAQCINGGLNEIGLLLLPETPALSDAAFSAMVAYEEQGGCIARVGTPIPYNAFGHSRYDVLRPSEKTILIRSRNNPSEFLHAMDTAQAKGMLPPIIRCINGHGYPLEGVKSQHIEKDGKQYLYLVNLRQEEAFCHLTGDHHKGTDLLSGEEIVFPTVLAPLTPMLLELEAAPPADAYEDSAPDGNIFSVAYISDKLSTRRRPNERSISRLSPKQ